MVEINQKIQIKIGKHRHFKGGMYEVIGSAKHSENLEKLVIYRSLDNGQLWVRPKGMFYDKVAVEGKEISRFKFVGN